jgi:hypothetical protein
VVPGHSGVRRVRAPVGGGEEARGVAADAHGRGEAGRRWSVAVVVGSGAGERAHADASRRREGWGIFVALPILAVALRGEKNFLLTKCGFRTSNSPPLLLCLSAGFFFAFSFRNTSPRRAEWRVNRASASVKKMAESASDWIDGGREEI